MVSSQQRVARVRQGVALDQCSCRPGVHEALFALASVPRDAREHDLGIDCFHVKGVATGELANRVRECSGPVEVPLRDLQAGELEAGIDGTGVV